MKREREGWALGKYTTFRPLFSVDQNISMKKTIHSNYLVDLNPKDSGPQGPVTGPSDAQFVDPNPKDFWPQGPVTGPSDAHDWDLQLIPHRLTHPT